MYAGWEFLLWALLLAAVVLWNTLQGVLRRRRRARQQAEAQARTQSPATIDLPVPVAVPRPNAEAEAWGRRPLENLEAWGRRPVEDIPLAAWEAAAEPPPLPRPVLRRPAPARDRQHHARWRTRAEVRQAVVGMTVLGPPRALAPWEAADLAAPGPDRRSRAVHARETERR